VAEVYDAQLFAAIGFSGHSIKHLAAAVATWYMVRFYQKYYQAPAASRPIYTQG
jgi:hypothetical protein